MNKTTGNERKLSSQYVKNNSLTQIEASSGECDCFRRFFGRTCELICINGVLLDGHCRCYDGRLYIHTLNIILTIREEI